MQAPPSLPFAIPKPAEISPALATLTRSHTNPSPLSSSSSSFASLTGFDDDPHGAEFRRRSESSMTSWGTDSRNGSFDLLKVKEGTPTTLPSVTDSSNPQAYGFAPRASPIIDLSSPTLHYIPLGRISPACSTHSSAQSRGESTPRAEKTAPVWPLSMSSYTNPAGRSPYGMDGLVDKEEIRRLGATLETTLRGRGEEKSKHPSSPLVHISALTLLIITHHDCFIESSHSTHTATAPPLASLPPSFPKTPFHTRLHLETERSVHFPEHDVKLPFSIMLDTSRALYLGGIEGSLHRSLYLSLANQAAPMSPLRPNLHCSNNDHPTSHTMTWRPTLSLDTRPLLTKPKTYDRVPDTDAPRVTPNTGETTPPKVVSTSVPCTPPVGQRILASSTLTGCQITAPLSPPAHYPSSSTRRASHSHSRSRRSTSTSSSSLHSLGSVDMQSPVPHWAKPPGRKETAEVSSLDVGEDAVVVKDEHDEQAVDGHGDQEGDYIEVIKGSEGRIAVRAEVECYHIMCWLPGFSLENITISAKGHQVVQIVADLWDDEDHAEWNVGLGTDADMKAISARFNNGELHLKVARKVKTTNPYWANRLRCTSMDEMSTTHEDTPIGTVARIGCRNPLPMSRSRTCDQP